VLGPGLSGLAVGQPLGRVAREPKHRLHLQQD
jgi:hypothetical protein